MMQIKLNKACTVNGQKHKAKAVVEVEPYVGEKLIDRGLAFEPVEQEPEPEPETEAESDPSGD